MAHLIKLEFQMKFLGKVINAVAASGQERLGCLNSFKTRKETINGRHRGLNEPGKDLALDAFLFLKAYLKIINQDDCIGYRVRIRIRRINARPKYWFGNVTSIITPQSTTFEKNNYILELRMIRSETIKNNSVMLCLEVEPIPGSAE